MSARAPAAGTALALTLALASACGPPPPEPLRRPRPRAEPPIDAGPDAAPADAPPALPAGIVDVRALEPSLVVDLVYAGPDGFLGRPAAGYHASVCYLTEDAARALARAQARLRAAGHARGRALTLLILDCYRPPQAVADFVRWAGEPEDPATRARFHPSLPRAELVRAGYIAADSGHTRATVVDLTIAEQRDGRAAPLDLGSPFDFFDPRSHADAADLTAEQRAARQLLREVMAPDFRPYRKEWWHFTLADEPAPRRYDFEIR